MSNRTSGEVTGLVVSAGVPGEPAVDLEERGWVAIGTMVRLPTADLEAELFEPQPEALGEVETKLADLLLLPELCSTPPVRPGSPRDGEYPRWGRTYYAQPPLGGQVKRWLVVSHDWFNAASRRAVCVRTTTRTGLHGPELPYIQRGLALAVCPDVMTKRHERFELDSAARLPQISFDEMPKVAIGLANFFGLLRQAGLRS
jgi:hypothetical protein